ncbi:MAG: prepilin-type N-terminal cleavage/methylation domain-containing protein [Lysobacterales bacterium]
MTRLHTRRVSGFSLIELMIAMAVGLVVIAGVVSFTVSTVGSVGRNIGATRVMQELRGAMSVMTREIKRSGYDRDALDGIARGVFPSGYAALTINTAGDCLLMSYDRVGFNDADNAPGAGEWKGFRRNVVDGRGIIQINTQANPPSCTADAGWIDLTSPQDVSVTDFRLTQTALAPIPAGATAAGPIFVALREVQIQMRASLVSDAATQRGLNERVRVRTDIVTFP